MVIYELLREDQNISIPITIGSYGENIPLLGSFLGIQFLAIGFWIGLLLSLFVPPEDTRARLLSLGFLLAGVTAAAGGASGWNSFWGANTIQLVLWSLLPPIIIAALLAFPIITYPQYRRLIINFFLVISFILVGLVLFGGRFFNLYLFSDLVGLTIRQVVIVYFMFSWIVGVGLLIRNRIISKDPETVRQTGIVIWGMIIGIGPFFALTLLPYLMFGTDYIPGFYTILFLGFLPLAYAYVIFQRKLLKVDFIINTIVVFFILILLILIVSIMIFGAVTLTLGLPIELPLIGGIIAAAIALPSASVQKIIQRKVNIILYGSHYDFSSVTSSLSSQLTKNLDRDNLVYLLMSSLARQMGINQIVLLLVGGDRLKLQQSSTDPFSVALDNELCVVLRDG